MPRTRTPIGSHGTIRYRTLGRRKVQARTLVRDADGVRREATAHGTSPNNARENLLQALQERAGFTVGSALSATSTLDDAAQLWLADVDARVAEGSLAVNSARLYRQHYEGHVQSALGALLLREVTVARVHNFLVLLRASSPSVAKACRTVLTGVCSRAVLEGALAHNPVRDVRTLNGGRRKRPKALTESQRNDWLAKMEADPVAVRQEIPDLTRFLLATACRIGEALGCSYEEFDRERKRILIAHTVVRVIGVGLIRTPPKTEAGERVLLLPSWCVQMLTERGERHGWEGPLFPTLRRGADGEYGWRDPSNTSRQLRAARDRAGFGFVTSHMFRKTVATVMEDAGFTPRQIADQLGHTKVSMTQDTYLGRSAVAAGAEALEDLWGTGEDDHSQVAPDGLSDES